MNLQYRTANKNDFLSICKLPENKQVLFYMFPNAKYPLDYEQLEEIHKKRYFPTVFLFNEKIVGYSNIYFMPNDNEPHIGHVILDKKYRGMGLGKEIMMVMINIALKEFIPKEIKLAVFETNKNVYELYKSIGFKSYETKYRKDYNGKNQKLILMKLEFNFLLNI